jgi:hypothetical protein
VHQGKLRSTEAAREDGIQKGFAKANELGQAANSKVSCKEVVGLHVGVFYMPFACGILRRVLRHLSLAKPIFVSGQFCQLRKPRLNLGGRQHL